MKRKDYEKMVLNTYSTYAQKEWKRLEKSPFHKLEYDTTMMFLEKFLPKKKTSKFLDAGGGPGRYSIALAKKGYNMTLLDFTKENLELAEKKIKQNKLQKKIPELVHGSIVDLSMFKNNSFDAVISTGGPLSHVGNEKDRMKAMKELVRVAKKGAPISISMMGKYGNITTGLTRWPKEYKDKKYFEQFAEQGEDLRWCYGTGYCHFFTLEELEKMVSKIPSVKLVESVGLEGLASAHSEYFKEFSKKHPKAYKNWLDVHRKTCTERTVVDMSLHMMIILRKK